MVAKLHRVWLWTTLGPGCLHTSDARGQWAGRMVGSKSITSGGPRDEACRVGKGKIPIWRMLVLWPRDKQNHGCGTVI